MPLANTRTLIKGYRVKSDEERIELIRNAVFESLSDPLTIWVARAMVARCPSRDEICEINAVHRSIKKGPIPFPTDDEGIIELPGLRYVEDVLYRDTYPTARTILEWQSEGAEGEDCDGHTILVASELMAIGYHCAAIIASKTGRDYVHIFPAVGIPRGAPTDWLPLETTVPEARPGWWPPPHFGVRKMKVFALKPGPVKGRVF